VIEPGPVRGRQFEPEDIADAVTYIVTRPARVEVNELQIRPLEDR
jgi:NADP-dependent 3-hydroxy acid dehydrogenase YdfG